MGLSRRAVEKLNTAMREAKSEGFKMVVAAYNEETNEMSFMSSVSNDPDIVMALAQEALSCMSGQTIKIAEA